MTHMKCPSCKENTVFFDKVGSELIAECYRCWKTYILSGRDNLTPKPDCLICNDKGVCNDLVSPFGDSEEFYCECRIGQALSAYQKNKE